MEPVVGVDLLLGEQAGLDAQGEVDLLLGVQQGDLADLLQVVLDRVGGGAGGHDLLHRGVVVVGIGVDEAGAGGGCGLAGLVAVFAEIGGVRSELVEVLLDLSASSSVALGGLPAASAAALAPGLGPRFLGSGLAAADAVSPPSRTAASLTALLAARVAARLAFVAAFFSSGDKRPGRRVPSSRKTGSQKTFLAAVCGITIRATPL